MGKTFGCLGAVAAFGLIFVGLTDYASTIVWWTLRSGLFWMIPFFILIVAVGNLLVFGDSNDSGGAIVGALALGLIGLVGTIWYAVSYHEYQQMRVYAANVEVVGGQVPELGARAPYSVAQGQTASNLGDTIGDLQPGTISYIPESDSYTTLVTRRGILTGYDSVLTQSIPLVGRGTGGRCQFNPEQAEDKVGGSLYTNLGREIAHVKRWWSFDNKDVYAYCHDSTPMIVVPMKRQVGGIFVVTQQFAGIALYNGHTGHVEIITDPKRIADLPGPAYPLSLAAKQREATKALGSYWDWVWDRAGWETTDRGDAGQDINSGNTSEFVLATPQGAAYVTPLTGRGSTQSISAVSLLYPSGGPGLATLRVHRLDPVWTSTEAIARRIQGDYQDLPNWQNIRVFEVTPVGANRWVATLGNVQNVLYRVEGAGDLQTDLDPAQPGPQATCLYNAGTTTPLRCGPVVNRDGAGPGVALGTSGTPGSPVPSGDLGRLTDAELAALLQQVNQEVARRLGQR